MDNATLGVQSNTSKISDDFPSEHSRERGSGRGGGDDGDNGHRGGNSDDQREADRDSSVISDHQTLASPIDAQQSLTSYGSQERTKSSKQLWRYGPLYTSNDAVSLFSTDFH